MFKVGIDIDNTLVNYTAALGDLIAIERKDYSGKYSNSDTFHFDNWDVTRSEFEKYHNKLMSLEGEYFYPMKGAKETLDWMVQTGEYQITIITHRANMNFYNIREKQIATFNTFCILNRLKLFYHDLCLVEDKSTVDCDFYIDDDPSVLRKLINADKNVLVFSHKYNEDIEECVGVHRVKNWAEIRSFCDTMMKAAVVKYGQ